MTGATPAILDPSHRIPLLMRVHSFGPALALLIAVPTLQAQEQRGARADSARADTARVAPVVVTASRVPISRAASPAAVSIVTGDEIRQQGITRIADVLQQLPGVSLAQTGSYGGTTALFLRGGESKYVKVLVDGVAVNEPGGAFDFGTLTVDNVERIEVVRGPASVLYGSDAVTGVVQIFTRRGASEPLRTRLSFRAGGYGSRDAEAAVTAGSATSDLSLAAAHHATQGIYDFNSGYRNTVLSGALRFAPDERTSLALTLRYTDHAFHYPTTGSGAAVDSNAVRAEDRTTIGVGASRRLTSRATAHLALASHQTAGGTDDQPQSDMQSSFVSLDDVRRRGANLWVDVRLPGASTVTVGAQGEQQDQRSQSQSTSGTFAFNSLFRASRTNRAVYAELLSGVGDAVLLTAGVRHDDNERFGGFSTYRVGASWRPLAATKLRATAGSAFREPTFFENYATGFVTGNPSLAPERSTSWELGIEQTLFAERLTLAATHFDQRFRDLIDYTGTTDACGASYCNVARARARGEELEAHLSITARLQAEASYTHLDTRVLRAGFDTSSAGLYRDGERLIRRPRASWGAGAAYTHARGTLDVRLTRVGERSDRDYAPFPAVPVTLDAYTTIDAGAEVVLVPRGTGRVPVTLTLRGENLGNARYVSVYGFRTPGRTLLAGARLELGSE